MVVSQLACIAKACSPFTTRNMKKFVQGTLIVKLTTSLLCCAERQEDQQPYEGHQGVQVDLEHLCRRVW